jgi:hypothetical protein
MTLMEYCLEFHRMWQCNNEMSCDGGINTTRCMAVAQHTCDETAAAMEGDIDAGRVLWEGQMARNCLQTMQEYLTTMRSAMCGDYLAYYQVYYGARTCDDGRESWDGGIAELWDDESFADCNRVFRGQVATGQSCGQDEVCVSATCTAADGGCGVCAVAPDAGVPTVRDGGCVVHQGDGGYTRACSPGWTCDETTEACLRKRAANEPCGPGLGECSLGCGYRCSDVDGGPGTCVPLPGAGQPCQGTTCARGHGCTTSLDVDAGYEWVQTCEAQAGDGQRCGMGYNYDGYLEISPYYADFAIGGWSYYGPVCQVGLVCDLPAASPTGTCRPVAAQPSGHACLLMAYPPDTCATSSEVCRHDDDGGSRCLPPLQAGQPCSSTGDCEPRAACDQAVAGGGEVCVPPGQDGQPCADQRCVTGHWCESPDGGRPTCRALVSLGGACNVDQACAGDYVTCLRQTCTDMLTADYDDPPMCQ